MGAGYAYTTDIKSNTHKTTVYGDNYFVYGQYKPEPWYVNGIFNFGHSNYKDLSSVTSRYAVNAYSGAVMGGYIWQIFYTSAGIRHTYVDNQSYTNELTTVNSKNAQVATDVIGTKIAQDFKLCDRITLTPEFRVAATYDVKSDENQSTIGIIGSSASYQVQGERLHRFGIESGIGLTALIGNSELSLNYEGGFRKDNQSNSGMARFKYHF